MAALGDNVGILFRIKADSADAVRDLSKVQTELQGVGTAGTVAAGGLTSMVNPATLIAAGIAAVATAAVTTTVALGKLIVSSAEFGSTLYDASVQTGLSAKSISALKLAADSSGSSLESVSGAVAKLNVLVGNAAAGNEKAQATLAKYGITATDTNEAFEQAVKVIGEMTNQTDKAAAAQALFKDRTGALLPIIDQVNGDFTEYIKTAERLGVVLTEEDLRAADDFGDALGLLGQQAKIAGAKFATEFMPDIVQAMSAASKVIGENMEVVREWGRAVVDTINGAILVLRTLGDILSLPFRIIDNVLANNQAAWEVWRGAVTVAIRSVLAFATAGISEIIIKLNELGEKLRATKTEAGGLLGGRGLGGKFNPGAADDDTTSTSAKPTGRIDRSAEQAASRDLAAQIGIETINLRTIQDELVKTFDDIRKEFRNTDDVQKFFASSTQGMDRFSSALQTSLTWLEQLERQQLKADASANERALLQAQQQERRQRLVKIGQDEYAKNRRELDDAEKRRSKEAEDQLSRELALIKQLMKAEQDRLDILKQFPTPDSVFSSPESFNIDTTDGAGEPPDLNAGSQFDQLSKMFADNPAATAGIDAMRVAFEGLAQAIGQAVAAWVLYGNAGTSAKKVAAQIIAAVAQMAATKAIFELAEGFAALARAFFGDPKAGAEAALHFKSAATYGIVAGIAAVAGRATAGNSFASSTSGGGAGGLGTGDQPTQRNNYTTPFRGFDETLQRQNVILGQLEETVDKFTKKTAAFSPGEIVGIGAVEASGEIRKAYESELGNDVGTTENFFRRTGQAR